MSPDLFGATSMVGAPVLRREALLSPCCKYRYTLWRCWDPTVWPLPIVMLNPSKADADLDDLDDPTIRRCTGFAQRDGHGGITVLNLYAWRATDPTDIECVNDPIGPDNDIHLRERLGNYAAWGVPILAAWGAHAQPERVREVLDLAPGVDWRCLGITKNGSPRHPLYVRADQPLVPWSAP